MWLAEEVKVNQISQRFVLISQMTILTFKAAEISVTSLTFNTNKFNLWPLSKTLIFQMDIWHFYYQIWSPHVCTVQYNLPRLKLQKDTQKWWKWRKRYWDLSKSMVDKSKVYENLNKSTLTAVWDMIMWINVICSIYIYTCIHTASSQADFHYTVYFHLRLVFLIIYQALFIS